MEKLTLIDKKTIAALGDKGTFTKEAAKVVQNQLGDEYSLAPKVYRKIEDVFDAAVSGESDLAVIPDANNVGGGVNNTEQSLFNSNRWRIRGEVILPIIQCLYHQSIPQDVESPIKTIATKDQAYWQSLRFLNKAFPDHQFLPQDSTTDGILLATQDATIAGVGGPSAAEELGVDHLLEKTVGIQDSDKNKTRFIVIQKSGIEPMPKPTGKDKTSLVMTIKNEPGSLLKVLRLLAQQNVNLNEINLIGKNEDAQDVSFLVSIDGHVYDQDTKKSLRELMTRSNIRNISSYPKAEEDKQIPDGNGNINVAEKKIVQHYEDGKIKKDNIGAVAFNLPNIPGALVGALEIFEKFGIDLTDINSAPSEDAIDRFFFYAAYKNNLPNREQLFEELTKYCGGVGFANIKEIPFSK